MPVDRPIDELDLEQATASIPNSTSTKLAEMVVCYRYLGLYKDISVLAMEELGKRRSNGDAFDFEQYIADKLATLPKIEFPKRDMSAFFKTVQRIIQRSQ